MRFEAEWWGEVSYREAWDRQLDAHAQVVEGGAGKLILLEHPPVLTLGANFHAENLNFSSEEYMARGIDVVTTDRGGDVTYHGPGQLVIYPIFSLEIIQKDLHRWLRDLEETMLHVLRSYGIEGRRFAPHTGAWVGNEKVAAIGVKVKRWVSLHGIAINCANSLDAFSLITPCGIRDYGVTSLSKLLGREVSTHDVARRTIDAFESVFGIHIEVTKPIPE